MNPLFPFAIRILFLLFCLKLRRGAHTLGLFVGMMIAIPLYYSLSRIQQFTQNTLRS